MKKVYFILIILAILLILTRFHPQPKKKTGIKEMSKIQNNRILAELHPAVKARFEAFLTAIEAAGYVPVLTSGYRSFQKQKSLKDQDNRNAAPGYSSHNYGMALDLCLVKGGKTWNKNTSPAEWLATGIPQIGKKMGFRWGGEFPGYPDPIHFDLQNEYPTNTLYKKALAQFGTESKVKGNEVKLA